MANRNRPVNAACRAYRSSVIHWATMEAADILQLLKKNDLFLGVPEPGLAALIEAGEVASLSTGDQLMEKGKTGQSIWVLLEGELEVLVDGDVVNNISSPGDLIGEISAVSMTPATATVRALGPVVALEIAPKSLHGVMENYADIAKSMVLSMTKYLGRR